MKKARKRGQPTKYHRKYNKLIVKFFNVAPTKTVNETFYYKNGDEKVKEIEVANELPLFQDFAHSINVNGDTLVEWAKPENKRKYPGFSAAYARAKELQEGMWAKNSLKGLYNGNFSIFFGKNIFNYKDKQEHDVNERVTIIEEQPK